MLCSLDPGLLLAADDGAPTDLSRSTSAYQRLQPRRRSYLKQRTGCEVPRAAATGPLSVDHVWEHE